MKTIQLPLKTRSAATSSSVVLCEFDQVRNDGRLSRSRAKPRASRGAATLAGVTGTGQPGKDYGRWAARADTRAVGSETGASAPLGSEWPEHQWTLRRF